MSNSDTEELKRTGRDNEELSSSDDEERVNRTASEEENEEQREERMRRLRDDNPDDDDYNPTETVEEEEELAAEELAAHSDAEEIAAEEIAAEVIVVEPDAAPAKSEKQLMVDKIANLERLLAKSKEEVVEIDIRELADRPWWSDHPDFPEEWHDRPRCDINPPMTPSKEDSPVNIFMFNLCARCCCIKLNRRRLFASERRRRTSSAA